MIDILKKLVEEDRAYLSLRTYQKGGVLVIDGSIELSKEEFDIIQAEYPDIEVPW